MRYKKKIKNLPPPNVTLVAGKKSPQNPQKPPKLRAVIFKIEDFENFLSVRRGPVGQKVKKQAYPLLCLLFGRRSKAGRRPGIASFMPKTTGFWRVLAVGQKATHNKVMPLHSLVMRSKIYKKLQKIFAKNLQQSWQNFAKILQIKFASPSANFKKLKF